MKKFSCIKLGSSGSCTKTASSDGGGDYKCVWS